MNGFKKSVARWHSDVFVRMIFKRGNVLLLKTKRYVPRCCEVNITTPADVAQTQTNSDLTGERRVGDCEAAVDLFPPLFQ